ncbi:hypothetical protein K4L06_18835 [Lysobacter sp. BMK333-48F3]|uniref:hypothetical protein n=1 Tax=Lysobacter sp. BMK333-48F3 TaxID=2867962 RepID=UPI001C8C8C14|nr:hypothetical protein [Lysobacter sp. BMK333-48F3]MBX9403374.1 hypothetical protein [Lysobacter sp. BMK333-48F3]
MQDAQDLKRLAADLAIFAQHLQEQSERAVQHVDRSADELQRTAQGMGAGAELLGQQIAQAVRAQTQEAIGRGAEQTFAPIGAQLRESAETAQRAAQALEEQRKSLLRSQQHLLYKGVVALLVGSVLAVGASVYFARKSMREIERAKFGADILEASRTGALTRCDGKLCARVGKRWGTKGDYVLLEE